MDIKHIYEHITIHEYAEYQIKVKGDMQDLNRMVKHFQTIQVTLETTDADYQICMLTISKTNQQKLFAFVNILLRNQFPVISVMCSNIATKKKIDNEYATSSG